MWVLPYNFFLYRKVIAIYGYIIIALPGLVYVQEYSDYDSGVWVVL